MAYHASDHPRNPKGTPSGGQFAPKAGVGGDDDLEPVSPYEQYSDDDLKSILSTPEANSPEYDDMRTELYARQKARQQYHNISYTELYENLREPDGGGTFSPTRKVSPVVGFCVSPYPQYSETLTLPDSAEEFQTNILEYYQRHMQLLQEDNTYIGLWHDPETDIIYLNISTVTDNATQARDACLTHDQIAFFDLQTGASVTVDRNATSGQGV